MQADTKVLTETLKKGKRTGSVWGNRAKAKSVRFQDAINDKLEETKKNTGDILGREEG